MDRDRILLVLCHAAEQVVADYKAALAAHGIDADVIAFVAPGVPGVAGGGLSTRYDALADRLAGARRPITGAPSLMTGLLELYKPPRPLDEYDHLVLATYSAGYAFARHLTDADRALMDGLVLIDSGHTGLDKDGTASDAGVAWAVRWAQDARAGQKVFAIGHSDVDPIAYASTTKFASEVVRLSGRDGELSPVFDRPPGCESMRTTRGFTVAAFNVRKDAAQEHIAALREWGPGFVAQACADALPPWFNSAAGSVVTTTRSVIGRAVDWIRGAFAGPREIADVLCERALRDVGRVVESGHNRGTEIDRYLQAVGCAPGSNWCAASVTTWLRDAFATLGLACPIKGSSGAKALQAQLQAQGRWFTAAELRANPGLIRPGLILVWHRGAAGAWTGHTGLSIGRCGSGLIPTCEGNSGPTGAETWRGERRLDDPLLLGAGWVD